MGTGQCDSPSPGAAVWNTGGATTVLLKEKVTDTTLGPVRAEAGAPLYVEDFHPMADSFNDGFLGRLKWYRYMSLTELLT